MPTFFDSTADAAEASEALRGLAHASRGFDQPAEMYGVIGDLSSGMRSLRQALDREGLGERVALVETGCMGPCVVGPVVLVGEDRTFYQGVKPEDAAEIVASHIRGGRKVESVPGYIMDDVLAKLATILE